MLDHLITRRAIVALISGCSLTAHTMKVSGGKFTPDSLVTVAANDWVSSHIREYNPRGGDYWRGCVMPVDAALLMIPSLRESGFIPLRLPWGTSPNNRFFPMYGNSGALSACVWHAFTRERNGKHEIVAFEHWTEHMTDFKARTGLSLVEAMEQA